MDVLKGIHTRRSIRQFKQDAIPEKVLVSLVDAARMAPQSANHQPLRYCIVTETELVKKVFAHLRWAAYVYPDGNPLPNCEPTAYIIMLIDSDIKSDHDTDAGAAGATLQLAAHSQGVGACWVGSVNRKEVSKILGITSPYKIHSVFALGYPLESPIAEEATESVRYYKDNQGVLHVPKRPLHQITFFNKMDKSKEV